MTLLGRTSHTGDFHPFQDCDSLCLQRHRNRATRFRPSGLNESAWLELPFHQFPRGWTRRFHKFRPYQFPAPLLPCAGGALKRDLHDPFDVPAALLKAHQQLDRAVDRCYRPEPFPSDRHRVEYLFALYEQLSEISDERIDKVKNVLKVGQKIIARVISIDKTERRIGL